MRVLTSFERVEVSAAGYSNFYYSGEIKAYSAVGMGIVGGVICAVISEVMWPSAISRVDAIFVVSTLACSVAANWYLNP